MFKRRPKPKYSPGDLLVHNFEGEFGNKNDDLFKVISRVYWICPGRPEKQWYYFGHILELRDASSVGLPKIPIYSTGLSNALEENLRKLEELVK